MRSRTDWTFSQYIEEIVLISEILEVPGMKQKRSELIAEVWQKYPEHCEELDLVGKPDGGTE